MTRKFPKNSILYTFIRDPGKRKLSEYFHFHVSRGQAGISDNAIIPALNGTANTIFHYIKPFRWINESEKGIHSILETYDFIGLVEREDESLVAMVLLWGLNIKDVLYVSSKSFGSYDDIGFFIFPAVVSPRTEAFIANDFQNKNSLDFMLYDQVNERLDDTIKKLGDKFHTELEKFQSMRKRANYKCHAIANFDKRSGQPTKPADRNCLWNDNGCAYRCLDDL